jgi:hypothetical protein
VPVKWLTEMTLGAREQAAEAKVAERKQWRPAQQAR